MKFKLKDRIRYFRRVPDSNAGKGLHLNKTGYIREIKDRLKFNYCVTFDDGSCGYVFCDEELEKIKPKYFKDEI